MTYFLLVDVSKPVKKISFRVKFVDKVVLMTCQPILSYFMPRG